MCVIVSQVTSIETESSACLPHDFSAADSAETDRPSTVGRAAAERGDITYQPRVATAGATEGSDTVSSDNCLQPGSDVLSTETKNIESRNEGGGVTATKSAETSEVNEVHNVDRAKNVESHKKGASKTAEGSVETTLMEVETLEHTESDEKSKTTTQVEEENAVELDKMEKESTAREREDVTGSSIQAVDETVINNITDFLALSYLVHPPDGTSFAQPYADNFWQCRWARMEPEVRRILRKSSRLSSDVITLDSDSSSEDYDSSEGEFSDENYEDSMGSASPIVVRGERTIPAAVQDEGMDDGEIVLDENSSNAIILGDDDDDDDDEIICSGETNGDDMSIVICDGDTSAVGPSPPSTGSRSSAVQLQDTELQSNRDDSVDGVTAAAQPDVSVNCAGAGKVANGSAANVDSAALVEGTGKHSSQTVVGGTGGDSEDVLKNGAACSVENT